MRSFVRLTRVIETVLRSPSVRRLHCVGKEWLQHKHVYSYIKKTPVLCMLGGIKLVESSNTKISSDPKICELVEKARILLNEKNYEAAEAELHQALLRAQEEEEFKVIARIYDIMADVAFEGGHYGKCKAILVESLKLLFHLKYEETDQMVLTAVVKLSSLYEKVNDHEKAIMGFEMALKKQTEAIEALHGKHNRGMEAFLGSIKQTYASYLVRIRQLDDAQKLFQEAYEHRVRTVGEDDTAATLLNDVAATCVLKENYEEAQTHYTKAIEMAKDPKFVATFLVNLGINCIQMNLKELAIKNCEKAASIGRKSNDQQIENESELCLKQAKKL